MSYKTVAIWGGTGNLGPAIVNNLISAGFDVVVLSRHSGRPDAVSDKAKIVQVDITKEHDKLVSTLKGVDAVISATGNAGFADQPKLIDAAVEAGVKLFFPSEFGANTLNPQAAALPVFGEKLKVQAYLEELAAKDRIGYVLLQNAALLDWGLEMNFLINATKDDPTTLWNGGDVKFSATTLNDIGKAVVAILKDPKPYWNRPVMINSTVTTQKQLLAAAKKAKPDGKWETQEKDTESVRKAGLETLQTGQGDIGAAMFGFLMSAVFDPAYGCVFEPEDSEKLGLKYLSPEEVDEIVKKIVLKSGE